MAEKRGFSTRLNTIASKAIYKNLPGDYAVKRNGYKLVGWTTTKDGASVLDRDYNVTKDVTLYAKWGKVYTVTFNAGAGHFGTDTTAKKKTYEAVSGENIGRLLYYDEYTPINGSKVFLGWYKDSSFKTPAKKSDTITKNITYYAKWATKTYKITVTNLKGASYWNRGTGKYVSESESTATSYTFYIQQGDSIGSLYAYKNDEQARLFLDKACKTKPYYYDYVPTANTTVYAKDLAVLLDLPRDYIYKYIKNLRAKIEGDKLKNADRGGFILSV